MTDIVQELRNPMWAHSNIPFESPQLEQEENLAAMNAAADEIERLRSRLDQTEADRESYKDQMIRAQLALHDAKRDLTDKAGAWDAIVKARTDEREECAKVAERVAGLNAASEPYTSYIQGRAEGAQAVAAHIRTRSPLPPSDRGSP